MKKLTLTALFSLTLLTACSSNAPSNQLFGANANHNITVSQAKSLPDDSRVVLVGNIIRQLDGEHYIFADSTGEIKVEIDHNKWYGLTVSASDTVRIQGELDREFFSSSIDVKYIERVQ